MRAGLVVGRQPRAGHAARALATGRAAPTGAPDPGTAASASAPPHAAALRPDHLVVRPRPELPFFVRRSAFGSLPVYTLVRSRGPTYGVEIRHITGDANDVRHGALQRGPLA